jgi:hypothetical protein
MIKTAEHNMEHCSKKWSRHWGAFGLFGIKGIILDHTDWNLFSTTMVGDISLSAF